MRKIGLILGTIALLAFALVFVYSRLLTHTLELTIYFQNANGLRPGAPVRLAGVEVGKITSVRARPEMQSAPAEVAMKLRTGYELSIPNDSTVSLATAGLLGETFAEINVLGTSGAPVKSGGVLKEKPIKVLSTEEIIEKLGKIGQCKPVAPHGKDMANAGAHDAQAH